MGERPTRRRIRCSPALGRRRPLVVRGGESTGSGRRDRWRPFGRLKRRRRPRSGAAARAAIYGGDGTSKEAAASLPRLGATEERRVSLRRPGVPRCSGVASSRLVVGSWRRAKGTGHIRVSGKTPRGWGWGRCCQCRLGLLDIDACRRHTRGSEASADSVTPECIRVVTAPAIAASEGWPGPLWWRRRLLKLMASTVASHQAKEEGEEVRHLTVEDSSGDLLFLLSWQFARFGERACVITCLD